MPEFRHRRIHDDVVVVTRRKGKPISTSVGKVKAKKSLPKKVKYSKPGQNIKKVKHPTLSDKEKPVKRDESTQANNKKRELIDSEIYSAIIRQIDALLPEPPFKIGISKEIFERLLDSYGISKKKLRRVVCGYMKFITSRKSYLDAAMKASHRHGIDGSNTEMAEEHRRDAAIRLKHIRIKQSKSSDRMSKSNGLK